MHHAILPLTLTLGLAGLTGCSMAPRYSRPAAPIPSSWPEDAPSAPLGGLTPLPPPADAPATEAASADQATAPDWREVFPEARLQALIELALDNNRDLRVALLNVEKARALYGIQRAAQLPHLDGQAGGSRSRTPADLSPTGRASTDDSYQIGLGVTSYELDLFGRVASLKDAALQTYLATEETGRSVRLTLVASVAQHYYAERATAEQLEIARQTLASLEASYALTKRSHEAGAASELDLRTAEAQLASVRADVASFEQSAAEARHALALLVGAAIPANLPPATPLADAPVREDLPAGLPSDLLQRRPDLLAAEHSLQSANADIGAARAAFFPRVTLTASGGTASADLDGLFDAGSGTWGFTPQLTVPIFNAGQNRARLKAARAENNIRLAVYEKSIQTAFREVSDALSARVTVLDQLDAQHARVAAEETRHRLSELRYRNGRDSYLVLLQAQRDLLTARQSVVKTEYARRANVAALYKALGGGWSA